MLIPEMNDQYLKFSDEVKSFIFNYRTAGLNNGLIFNNHYTSYANKFLFCTIAF